MTSTLSPRIYVACLASYNAGKLHGAWIDATQDVDAIEEEIRTMLAESTEAPAEEYAIHDYEDFGGYKVGEYDPIADVALIAEKIAEHGEAFALFLANGDQAEDFEEAYAGVHDSKEDFARQLVDDMYDMEKMMGRLAYYFDYEAFARDLFIGDYWGEHGSEGFHVFRRM